MLCKFHHGKYDAGEIIIAAADSARGMNGAISCAVAIDGDYVATEFLL